MVAPKTRWIDALGDSVRRQSREVARLKREVEKLHALLRVSKGPCSNKECELEFAHDGPCRVSNVRPTTIT
jgi:hypothetical protein